MCGRFFFFGDTARVQAELPGLDIPYDIGPRYNISPGQPVAVVVNAPRPRLDHFLWGLVPSWAKDTSLASRLINARAETLAEKPSFRAALRRRRCLILADGFYEWFQPPDQLAKTPMAFRLHPPRLFAFAGLWEAWLGPDGSEILSVAIITTAANAFIAPYHARTPVILDPAHYAAWLSPEECAPHEVLPLLQPPAPEMLEAFPVSTLVNNSRIDVPACLEAMGAVDTMDTREKEGGGDARS